MSRIDQSIKHVEINCFFYNHSGVLIGPILEQSLNWFLFFTIKLLANGQENVTWTGFEHKISGVGIDLCVATTKSPKLLVQNFIKRCNSNCITNALHAKFHKKYYQTSMPPCQGHQSPENWWLIHKAIVLRVFHWIRLKCLSLGRNV